MKVFHIVECAGGVEMYLRMLLPLLNNGEISQILLCSFEYKKEHYSAYVDNFFQIEMNQSFSIIKILNTILKTRQLLKEHNPDIIYCHSSFAGGFGRIASIGLKSKIVYNPHGWAFNMKSSLFKTVFLYTERLLSIITDRIVCISIAELNSAINKKITKKEKLKLIPNGINIEKIKMTQCKDRKQLGIPDDAFIIGMVGRLSPQKAPDIFIKSAKLILEKIPNAFFIIVGSGNQQSDVVFYANTNNIPLLITGWIDTSYEYIKLFDIGVLLSRWEGFGLSLIEYMASEKNCIATRVDALPTIIQDGIDGILVDVDSPQQVAESVFYLYNNPSVAKEMRRKALIKVRKDYDIHRVADQHIEMFMELIS